MNILQRSFIPKIVLVTLALAVMPKGSFAQTPTDEIQVYDASIVDKGIFNLTLHDNFTPVGLKEPAFPGAIIGDKSFNGVPEFAYGITDWWEQGLYFPVYSISKGRGATFDSMKLRELFVRPHADSHKFFYGVNFEFSFNAKYWEDKRFTSEVRPIIGLHLKPWDIIVNPIFDTNYTGIDRLEFVPAERLAYNFNDKWAGAVEEYADYGPLNAFFNAGEAVHNVWAVVDHSSKTLSFEAGIGFGVTGSSDRVVLKLMLMRDLTSKPWPRGGAASNRPGPNQPSAGGN
jgi:hypothetical protein